MSRGGNEPADERRDAHADEGLDERRDVHAHERRDAHHDQRRLEAVARGRVQGVGYRMFVIDAATALGLVGWVANEPGGSVRTVAEGSEAKLLALLRELRAGPSAARVDAVDETWSAPSHGFDRFSVRSGWHAGD